MDVSPCGGRGKSWTQLGAHIPAPQGMLCLPSAVPALPPAGDTLRPAGIPATPGASALLKTATPACAGECWHPAAPFKGVIFPLSLPQHCQAASEPG